MKVLCSKCKGTGQDLTQVPGVRTCVLGHYGVTGNGDYVSVGCRCCWACEATGEGEPEPEMVTFIPWEEIDWALDGEGKLEE